MGLKSRQKVGKYRIERKLGQGGFASVYRAYDTIEGVRVALKVPHAHLVGREMLDLFRKEVRVNAQLDHPNILPVKYAGFLDGRFVIVSPLGTETLEARLARRLSTRKAIDWAEQMIEAVAFAHAKRIRHSDLKPENFILFGDTVRLADFGLARVTYGTITASGSGTVGYLAPEQALGRPSLRSDVFSLGLIVYRMFTGELPEWPFEWPFPGADRLRSKVNHGMTELLRKALDVNHRRRFADAVRMRAAFRRIKPGLLVAAANRRRKRSVPRGPSRWKEVRFRDFQRRFGRRLATRFVCGRCRGPVSEPMRACPWCGKAFRQHRSDTDFPARCGRCGRGRKLDWRFCPWCYGPGFAEVAARSYADRRYRARCSNEACADRRLMPFMKYCPWCRRKVKRTWKIATSAKRCTGCGWDVLPEYWEHCPWCARRVARR